MLANIPDEILLKIFSKLTTKQLLLNVALVNKQFYRISKDPSLLKIVILENIDNYVYESVENLLKNATKIQTFIIKESVLKKEHLLSIALQTSKVLKTVIIKNQFCQNLAKVLLEHGQNIENLDLSNSFQDAKYDEIIFPSNMTRLKSIKFCDLDESLNSKHIKSMALNCKYLKEVGLPKIESFSDELMDEFCNSLKNLETLSFRASDELKWKFNGLASNGKLKELKVKLTSYSVLDSTQVSNICKIPNLKVFCLEWDLQGESVLIDMFSNFKMDNLEKLWVEIPCKFAPLNIFKVIINRLGSKLKILGLTCPVYCKRVNCPNTTNLNIEDVKSILKKSPDLEHLGINVKNLPEQFLCEIKYKHKTKISVDQHKYKSMRRFQIFNPKFFENMTFL